MTINEQTFLLLEFYQWRHHNRGFIRDADGTPTDTHAGYGWTWRCVEIPRITFTDWFMLPDREPYRVWHVDGDDYGESVGDQGMPGPAFYDAINKPPQLTLAEFAAWLRIGPDRVPAMRLTDTIAGAKSDNPNIIDGEPWASAYRLYERLGEKGLIGYDNTTDEFWRKEK